MKGIVEYIFESAEKIVPTDDLIKTLYTKFNTIYFYDQLPDVDDVDLRVVHSTDAWLGQQSFNSSFFINESQVMNGKYIMLDQSGKGIIDIKSLGPRININSKYKFSESQLEDTLIHEMVHLYTYIDCCAPKIPHGREFKRKCRYIREMAKVKYNKDYELTTLASRERGGFEVINSEDSLPKNLNKSRSKTMYLLKYTLEDVKKFPNRYVIVSESYLNKIWDEIAWTHRFNLVSGAASKEAYINLCKIYQFAFRAIRKYTGYKNADKQEVIDACSNVTDWKQLDVLYKDYNP